MDNKLYRWVTEKPKLEQDCILLVATEWKKPQLHYEYTLYTVEKVDDGLDGWYWGLICDDGQEWGDIADLKADLYFVMPLIEEVAPIVQTDEEFKNITVKVFKVIGTVRAQYPTSVFPDNGMSQDAKSGIVARLICDNIKREMEIIFNDESTHAKAGDKPLQDTEGQKGAGC